MRKIRVLHLLSNMSPLLELLIVFLNKSSMKNASIIRGIALEKKERQRIVSVYLLRGATWAWQKPALRRPSRPLLSSLPRVAQLSRTRNCLNRCHLRHLLAFQVPGCQVIRPDTRDLALSIWGYLEHRERGIIIIRGLYFRFVHATALSNNTTSFSFMALMSPIAQQFQYSAFGFYLDCWYAWFRAIKPTPASNSPTEIFFCVFKHYGERLLGERAAFLAVTKILHSP